MKRKTRKELEVVVATQQQQLASLNTLFGMYVNYRGDSDKFQEYLKEELGKSNAIGKTKDK
tara:strand:- start:1197 stop:1379 length:183 start_codon:yes stop_codon:yes gene_type:complete